MENIGASDSETFPVIVLVSGERLLTRALLLYEAEKVAEIAALKAQAAEKLQGFHTGIGFWGSPGWVLGGATALGLVEGLLSSGAKKEGLQLLQTAARKFQRLPETAVVFPSDQVRRLASPHPDNWSAVIKTELELPLAYGDRGPRRALTSGVLSGPCNRLIAAWWGLRGRLRRQAGYAVNVDKALGRLETTAPDAASWWRENCRGCWRETGRFCSTGPSVKCSIGPRRKIAREAHGALLFFRPPRKAPRTAGNTIGSQDLLDYSGQGNGCGPLSGSCPRKPLGRGEWCASVHPCLLDIHWTPARPKHRPD